MTGCEGRREPRAGGEELFQRVEFVQAPLADGRQVGLDDSEVDQPLEGAPAATGAALLDLDRPLVAFREIVGEVCRMHGVRVVKRFSFG